LRCERGGGRSLRARWLVVIGWIVKPMLVLLALVVVLHWLFER
jgi:hypothetical protein